MIDQIDDLDFAEFKDSQRYAVENEQAYLGSILLSRSQRDVIEAANVDSFWRPAHRVIYSAMLVLSQSGREIDMLTLTAELDRKGKLIDCGGEDYLLTLAEFVPSAANWRAYAEVVLEAAQRRAYIDKCKKIQRLAIQGADLDELRALDETPPRVGHVGRAPIVSVSDIELPDSDDDQGVTTGFKSLDDRISTGGYPRAQMTMVSAYHKGGKSTFMLSSYAKLAESGFRVLYATFADLNAVRLKRRLLRNLTGWSKMPLSNLDAQADFVQANGDMDLAWSAWMYDATSLRTGGDVETFTRWLEASHARYRFDAVFIDYAQKMTSSSRKASNPVSEQDICSTELSRCFERTGIAGIVGSQITEGTQERKAITKGSRKWEEDAAWVLRIKEETEKSKLIEIPYSRFGKQGGEPIRMVWSMSRLRFEEMP